jgi:hypothetical protein
VKVYQEQRLGESEWAERIGAAVGAVLAVGVIWFVVTSRFLAGMSKPDIWGLTLFYFLLASAYFIGSMFR